MKTKSIIVIAAALGIIGTAGAQGSKPERKGGGHTPPPEVIEEFDKDGDGKLNEEERQAARAAHKEMMEARKKEVLKKFDADKDGKLNESEKEAMKAEHKKRMLEKFDTDKDGELNDDEKKAMREEMQNRPGGPRGKKGGPRGKRGGPGAEAPGAVE
ncbi:hypothetical protein ACFSSA_13390 [Luteolibacter algae]|uniref:EF-hand domain-containing protein n=1 Tax=Luteolibacter algae TaxID=454151 RepID=A0ABW5DC82_9BACT